jgi:Fe-S-cluster containining protein
LGSDCEDNCCHDWRVTLDKASYKKTKKHSGRHVRKISKNRTVESFGEIIHLENGDCPFLGSTDKLCVIHKNHGESSLSKTCRTYPRRLAKVGDRLEQSLELSCPEATRGLLLEEFSLIQTDHNPFIKDNYQISHYGANESGPYSQNVDLIRSTVLQLLNFEQYPIATRLFFLLFFTHRTVPIFSNEIKNFSAAQLTDEIQLLNNPEVLENMHEQFKTFSASEEVPVSLPMSHILNILVEVTGTAGSFSKLLHKIWKNYGHNNSEDSASPELTPEALSNMITEYTSRLSNMPEAVNKQFEDYLNRYSQYFWFSHLYMNSPNLLIHTRRLFIRLALLRFLLFSHPDMNEFIELNTNHILSPEQTERIGSVAVEAFYLLSRGIEHKSNLLTSIENALDKSNMNDFEHICLLLLI